MSSRPVLYVEDEENDVFLMKRAFAKAGVTNSLEIVTDGAAAIRRLSGVGEFADHERFSTPCLLLLDLNLPRRSGLEVVEWVRAQPRLKALPVVLLTSSNQERDIKSAHALGANGYLVKPASSEKLIEVVTTLRDACLIPDTSPQGWLDFKGNQLPPAKS
jgi:CheY-like chemotaxis protein